MKKITLMIILIAMAIGFSAYAQPTVNVTFRVDLDVIPPSALDVHVVGDFQGWDPTGTPMTNVIGTIWSTTYEVPANSQILFKYLNGNDWPDAEAVPEACGISDGFGGYNRFADIGEDDIILPIVCFSQCVPCNVPEHQITLQIDMSEETVSELGVHVAGSFNGWSPNTTELLHQGNGIYATTLSLEEGTYQLYKFINGDDWGTPGVAQEIVPAECGVDDGNGGYNRFTTIPDHDSTYLAVCYSSCVECASTNFSDVTFVVDMTNEIVSPEGVHIAGSFNGWSPDATALTDNGDGTWELTLNLQEGTTVQYKFINGITWDDDEDVWGLCNVGGNREVLVPEPDVTLDVVCFGYCNICNPPEHDVTFSVDLSEQSISGEGVHLAGSLQGWDPSTTAMTDVGNDIYEVTLSVGEGDYHEFKYVNGITWDDAEFVPGECNRNGNRWLLGESVNTGLDTVCFGQCEQCINTLYTFNLKVFLEGPFNGSTMNTSLFDESYLPVDQPYNSLPWEYDGTEILTASGDTPVVDWVLVEFRETDGDASTATPDKFLDRQAALLLSDGHIVQPDGLSPILYTGNITQNLYVLIHHRNHLSVMSSEALVESAGTFDYNFTTGLGQAYNSGHKNLGGGIYGLYGGDSDASGIVNMDDIDLDWDLNAGSKGYIGSDLNLNGQVSNQDKNDIWEPNENQEAQLPIQGFNCGDLLLDERDGQSYNTVLIGTQCWMAENLNYGTRINGNISQTNNQTIEKWCQENLNSNCDIYGGLYQWDETMDYTTTPGTQGICPMGWHVPTDDEWCVLTNEVDAGSINCNDVEFIGIDVGGNLKEIGYDHWLSPNTGATNSSSFTGLGAGYNNLSGVFDGFYEVLHAWTSDEIGGNAWDRAIGWNSAQAYRWNFGKTYGFSIRCIKDN